jgi:hypothetical protein
MEALDLRALGLDDDPRFWASPELLSWEEEDLEPLPENEMGVSHAG